MIESGLVTFSPSKRCKSVDNPNKTTSYTDVWHIDVNHLYRQRLMAGTVHNGDKVVHNGDKVVHNGDKLVHNGDTNNTIDNTNNNTKTTPGGVEVIRAFIAATFAMPISVQVILKTAVEISLRFPRSDQLPFLG